MPCPSKLEQAVYYQCLKIRIMREDEGQMPLYLGETVLGEEYVPLSEMPGEIPTADEPEPE